MANSRLSWVLRQAFFVLSLSVMYGSAAAQEPETRAAEETLKAIAEEQPGGGTTPQLEWTEEDLADLLADPDDIGLNVRYALARLAAGDLPLAAAALERVLMVQPGLEQVRLLYAFVLYRLGNLPEAQNELAEIDPAALAPREAERRRRLMAILAHQSAVTGYEASVGIGILYDGNRNAYPDSGRVVVGGVNLPLSGGTEDDLAQMALASVGVIHDPGHQRLERVFGSLGLVAVNQVELDELDATAAALRVGGSYVTDYGQALPQAYGNIVLLDRETFLRDVGLQFGFERALAPGLGLALTARAGYEDYVANAAFPANDDRDGWIYGLAVGVERLLGPATTLGGRYGLEVKNAEGGYRAYVAHELAVEAVHNLPSGIFVTGGGSLESRRYDGPDPFVGVNRDRKDDTRTLALALGLPVGNWLGAARLEDLVLTLGAEYEWVDSNIPNFEYDALRARALLTQRWRF